MHLTWQTLSHAPLEFYADLPARFFGTRLPGGNVLSAEGQFGSLCIQEFDGGPFIIRYSVLDIEEDLTLLAKSHHIGLHTIIMLRNQLTPSIKNAGSIKLLEGQFTMLQANQPEATVSFKARQRYETFETLYHPPIVEEVLIDFPTLAASLLKESPLHPNILVNSAEWTNEETKEIVSYILNYAQDKQWRRSYFEDRVSDILFQLMIIVSHTDPFEMLHTDQEINSAYEAQKLILKDISKHIIIRDLAKKVNTSESKLKRVFKRIFGKTLHDYLVHHRLKAALSLIHKGLSVKETAARTGWSSSYLIKMYTRKYHTSPGSANAGKNKN